MSANVVQHHESIPDIEVLSAYAKDCLDKNIVTKYDVAKFGALIGKFAPKLALHLADEIKTLLGLDKYEAKKIHQCYLDFENAR